MAAALPVAKLFFLAVKQISKPIARSIKESAVRHDRVRNWVVVPMGQAIHWLQVTAQRITLNSKRRDVRPLSDADAVTAGAELISEGVVFTVAAVIIINEYRTSSEKSAAKEAAQEAKFESLRQAVEKLTTEVRQLRRDSRTHSQHLEMLARKNRLTLPPPVPDEPLEDDDNGEGSSDDNAPMLAAQAGEKSVDGDGKTAAGAGIKDGKPPADAKDGKTTAGAEAQAQGEAVVPCQSAPKPAPIPAPPTPSSASPNGSWSSCAVM